MRRKLIPLLALCMLQFSGCVQKPEIAMMYQIIIQLELSVQMVQEIAATYYILMPICHKQVPFTMIMQQWENCSIPL